MKQDRVIISVIVPVYNAIQWLDECVQSVLNQTFEKYELILVDDESTDGSGELCDRYAQQYEKIKVIHKKNGFGAGEARNAGLKVAEGEFVVFLDSDDCQKPQMLEKLYQAQQGADYDLVMAGYQFLEDKNHLGPEFGLDDCEVLGRENVLDYFIRYYPDGLVGYPWNKLYRRSIIETYDISFPKMRRLEDGIFNVEYFQHVEKLCVMKEPLIYYRVNSQVTLRKLPYNFYENIQLFSKNYYDFLKKVGRQKKESEAPFVFYFLNDFVCCLENILANEWPEKSFKERKADVLKLHEDKMVRYMLKQKSCVLRYSRIVLSLFEKHHIELLTLMIHVKIWLKTYLKQIFAMVKKKVN